MSTNEISKNDEHILLVPKSIAEMPLGFVIDAGGTLTKLIYRSKEEYENGQIRNGYDPAQGRLRLRYFHLGMEDDLIEFIRNNCDVMESITSESGKDGNVWLQTGINAPHLKTKLEQAFNIRIKVQSESIAIMKCAWHLLFQSRIPELAKFVPPSIAAVNSSLIFGRSIFTGYRNMETSGDECYAKMMKTSFFQDTIRKTMTIDAESWAEELGQQRLDFPCIVTTIGSGTISYIMFEDGKYIPCYVDKMAGKSFIALGETMTGAKSFEELMEMASRGDSRKVDVTCKDHKNPNEKDDWYSALPDEMIVFSLGKMTRNNFEGGSYTKDDMAAAILQLHCSSFANVALLNARIHKIKSIVFVGSFVAPGIARKKLEQCFLQHSMTQFFQGLEDHIKIHFLPHPGFTCSFGVWFQNLDDPKRNSI